MGRKLLLVLIAALGLGLTMCDLSLKERDSLASFGPSREALPTDIQTLDSPQTVVLPYTLADSGLVAEELVAYDGPYVEDGSWDPVKNMAALLVYNAGQRDISSAMVTVVQGERRLHFFLTWLPAGSRVLVLERGRKIYSSEPIRACESTGVRWEVFYRPSVWFRDEEGLTVINGSAETVQNLRLRYKTYVEKGDYYLGGITYCAYVGDLDSGECRILFPEQDPMGNSKVVAVLTMQIG